MMRQPFLLNRSRLSFAVAIGMVIAIALSSVSGVFAAPLTDPLVNGGFEQAGSTAKQAYDWQAYGQGYERMSGQKRSGSSSLRLRTTQSGQQAGAYQRIDLNQTTQKPVFVGAWVKGNNIVLAPNAWIGASIYAEIHLHDGSVVYWNSVKNSGTFDWRWIGFNTGTLPLVNQPIDHIFVVPILAEATGTAWFDDVTVSEHDPSGAAVSIVFDDGEITTYTEAKPAMDKYGFVGSAAITTSLIGQSGYMSRDQVKQLATGGWEIMSHGVTHEDFTLGTIEDMRAQLRRSINTLTNWGLRVYHVAYPFGAYNATLLAETAKFYTSGRAYELGDNPQGTFPFDVKVRSVVNTTTPADVAAWIAEAEAQNRWVVIVFHTIAHNGDDAYHTSPETFRAIIDEVAKSGVRVVTYDQGVKAFGVTKPGVAAVLGTTVMSKPLAPILDTIGTVNTIVPRPKVTPDYQSMPDTDRPQPTTPTFVLKTTKLQNLFKEKVVMFRFGLMPNR